MTAAKGNDLELHNMKDHDLLVRIAVKTDALEQHSAEQNGQIEKLSVSQLRLEGAVSLGKWIMATVLGVGAIVAAIIGGFWISPPN